MQSVLFKAPQTAVPLVTQQISHKIHAMLGAYFVVRQTDDKFKVLYPVVEPNIEGQLYCKVTNAEYCAF